MDKKLPGTKAKSVSMFTLGVADLQKSIDFYEALGFECSADSDNACTFVLAANIPIGLVPYDFLAEDALLPVEPKQRYNGFTMAINGKSEEETNQIFERAIAAGATVQQQPVWKDWAGNPGYSGYFLDPDGYVWEVAYNTTVKLTEDNCLIPRRKSK